MRLEWPFAPSNDSLLFVRRCRVHTEPVQNDLLGRRRPNESNGTQNRVKASFRIPVLAIPLIGLTLVGCEDLPGCELIRQEQRISLHENVCNNTEDCGNWTPSNHRTFCLKPDHVCVVCRDNDDCRNLNVGSFCTKDYQCAECLNDSNCAAASPDRPLCVANRCIACTKDADCKARHLPGALLCDSHNRCAGQCRTDSECNEGTKRRCWKPHDDERSRSGGTAEDTGSCEECIGNADCASGICFSDSQVEHPDKVCVSVGPVCDPESWPEKLCQSGVCKHVFVVSQSDGGRHCIVPSTPNNIAAPASANPIFADAPHVAPELLQPIEKLFAPPCGENPFDSAVSNVGGGTSFARKTMGAESVIQFYVPLREDWNAAALLDALKHAVAQRPHCSDGKKIWTPRFTIATARPLTLHLRVTEPDDKRRTKAGQSESRSSHTRPTWNQHNVEAVLHRDLQHMGLGADPLAREYFVARTHFAGLSGLNVELVDCEPASADVTCQRDRISIHEPGVYPTLGKMTVEWPTKTDSPSH